MPNLGRGRAALAITTAAVLVVGLAPHAAARTVDLDEERPVLRNRADFDMGQFQPVWLDGPAVVVLGGSFGERFDAFDGGLAVEITDDATDGKTGVAAPDGRARVDRDTLTFDPSTAEDLLVSTTYQALPGTSTMRVLVKVTNTLTEPVERAVRLKSDYGSDSSTVVGASSDGNAVLESNGDDRWVVTSDGGSGRGADPVVTQAWFGTGQVRSTDRILYNPSTKADLVTLGAQLVLGAGQTRYLLFYARFDKTVRAARRAAQVFDRRRLSADLLAGISPRVRRGIVNWDL